jgi:hypothetical protein
MTQLNEFVRQCLFFKSNETANRIFGALAWSSIVVFLIMLIRFIQSYL